MFHLNSCQLKAPCFFSKNVPINRTNTISIKKIKICLLNNKTFIFQEKGKWINRRISISKIINRIINIKNRTEKGLRLELNVSIPHSNALLASRAFISIQTDTIKITKIKIDVIIIAVIIETTKFNISKWFNTIIKRQF